MYLLWLSELMLVKCLAYSENYADNDEGEEEEEEEGSAHKLVRVER